MQTEGEITPESLQDRLRWLSCQGTVTVIKEDYPWCRGSPWMIRVEIGALEDSHITVKNSDLLVAAWCAIDAVRAYWKNPPWRGESSSTHSIGGVVFND